MSFIVVLVSAYSNGYSNGDSLFARLFSLDNFRFTSWVWWISQFFALICLVFFIWCFQIRNKVKMMTLTGIGCMAFAVSAALLSNFAISGMFVLAGIRNFVFAYFDWRIAKGKRMDKWLYYFFCGFFIVTTIASTVVLNLPSVVYFLSRGYYAVSRTPIWLEVVITATLIGLIVGNILKGTNVMRISFIINRIFTIINHIFVGNLIGMIIAVCAIISNFVYYIKLFIDIKKKRLKKNYFLGDDDVNNDAREDTADEVGELGEQGEAALGAESVDGVVAVEGVAEGE